jgi:heat shock protein HslJ
MTKLNAMSRAGALRAALVLPLLLGLAACADGTNQQGVTTATLPGESGSGVGASATSPLLGTWRLVSLQEAGQAARPIANPDDFTATFEADGRLSARVDCNRCGGRFEATGSKLAIDSLMACTRAYCGDDSLDRFYQKLLPASKSWRVEGAGLELGSEQGVLRFER